MGEYPQVFERRAQVRQFMSELRSAGRTIGLVPTMGALHDGHLSLIDASVGQCDTTVATIFVNPTQFGPGEDYEKYPRPLERDLELLASRRVDAVFVPQREEMYRPFHSTSIDVGQISRPLEGKHRPGHFQGVATVVMKLLQIIPANRAYFGQKDYQQFLVIRQMVEDLDVPIELTMCPIVRDPDGMAMSSRNAYLSVADRSRAACLSRALFFADKLVEAGEQSSSVILANMHEIIAENGGVELDYLVLVDPDNLSPVRTVNQTALAAVAAKVGITRLIDNHLLTPPAVVNENNHS